jgi:hypothetical protein
MTVFDKGRYSQRLKQNKPGRNAVSKKSDWLDGFNAGYEAALSRYIALERKDKKKE